MGDGSSTCLIFHPRPCFDHTEMHVRKVKEFTENPPNVTWIKYKEIDNVNPSFLINKLLVLFAIGFEVLLGVVSNGVYDRFCCRLPPVEILSHKYRVMEKFITQRFDL